MILAVPQPIYIPIYDADELIHYACEKYSLDYLQLSDALMDYLEASNNTAKLFCFNNIYLGDDNMSSFARNLRQELGVDRIYLKFSW